LDKVFIVGCGQIGRLVAALYRKRGVPVCALVRRRELAGRGRDGVEARYGDLDLPSSLTGLPLAGSILFHFAPPPASGEGDPRTAALLAAASAEPPEAVVYISTSGVYGDRDGAWVDESTPPAPATGRARRRVDAESRLFAWGRECGVRCVVLRVGGIYGPGRLPLDRLRKGLPVVAEAESGFTNRVHAEDLATACVAAADRGAAGAVYNISDGRPGTMTGYFKAVAERLGLPQPPEIGLAEARQRLSPAMLSYLTESRRMDNRRMREELGVVLRYPDLASGLAAIDPEAELARPG
jgi:nucleoside-diphosphate-sugar epimerase